MEYSEIYARIKKVIRDDKNDSGLEITADTTLDDLGYTSTGKVALGKKIELEFDISIKPSKSSIWSTVRDIAKTVKSKVG